MQAKDQEEDQKQLGEKPLKTSRRPWIAEARAKNRDEWRHLVLTLCSHWSEEDR